jgi:hypothetical protein
MRFHLTTEGHIETSVDRDSIWNVEVQVTRSIMVL